jgi:UrcA family protein
MKTYIVPFSALALLVGAPAAANDFVVNHSDLDLSNPKAQKTLERRIDTEARKFCGMDRQITGTRTQVRGTGECFRSARDAAREQMVGLIASAQKGG